MKSLSPREVRTLLIGVPGEEWYAVTHGHKTEFRLPGRPVTWAVVAQVPTPVVLYSRLRPERRQLMVLERAWREDLRDISPESLEAEGFESFAAFRRYWTIRESCRFQPLQRVWCFSVSRWRPSDVTELGARLVHHLYGEHMT